MIFGECPYCEAPFTTVSPDETPAFEKITCEECGKWYKIWNTGKREEVEPPQDTNLDVKSLFGEEIHDLLHRTTKELEAKINHLIERSKLEARLDELIWSTGVEYKYDRDRIIIQKRIKELTKELEKE